MNTVEIAKRSNVYNWDIRKGNANNSSSYEELIPNSIIEGYRVDAGIFTTFGLDMRELNKLLVSLECTQIANGKLDVFYDVQGLGEIEYNVMPQSSLHGMNLHYEGIKYAFHPKVILLRYIKREGDGIRYVVAVLSKNITPSNLLDTFFVAYGDVGETVAAVNGEQVAEFVQALYERALDEEKASYWDELKKVDFKCADTKVKNIKFLTGSDMKAALENMDNIIVISPYISGSVTEKPNVKKVISVSSGYEKAHDIVQTVDKSVTDPNYINKYYTFSEEESVQLHAKIYCGKVKEKENTRIILGSSNATNNGCGLNASPNVGHKNMEFNVALDFDRAEYEKFEKTMEQYSCALCPGEIALEAEGDNFDKKSTDVLGEFLSSIDGISVEKIRTSNDTYKWKVGIRVIAAVEESYSLQLSMDNETWVEMNRTLYCNKGFPTLCEPEIIVLETEKVTSNFLVCITRKRNGEVEECKRKKIFCIRIVPFIHDRQNENTCDYLKELDKQRNANYVKLIKAQINSILNNAKRRTAIGIEVTKEPEKGLPLRSYSDKKYIFEKFKELAILTQQEAQRVCRENAFQKEEKDEERQKLYRKHKELYIEKMRQLKESVDAIKEMDDESRAMAVALEVLFDKESKSSNERDSISDR